MKVIRSALLFLMLSGACMDVPVGEPAGQFGPYHAQNKRLYLADGDSLTVYRVKRWEFKDGSPPALQLEYASPVPVSDTAALRRVAERIWPAFAPYVESQQLTIGILTATELQKLGGPGAWTTRTHSFGLVAVRDSMGSWHFEGHHEALAGSESAGKARLVEANGTPFSFAGDKGKF